MCQDQVIPKRVNVKNSQSYWAMQYLSSISVNFYQDYIEQIIPDYLDPIVTKENDFMVIKMIDNPDIIVAPDAWIISDPGSICRVVDDRYFNAFYEVVE